MKLAVAGKGGVGKTSLAAWLGDWLARRGEDVWLVDADTSQSLGRALGLSPEDIPVPLIERRELIDERVGRGFINLSPEVGDLPEKLSVRAGNARLLVLGGVTEAGGGCACSSYTLLKSLVAHLVLERGQRVIIDLEAGVEHLGRGAIAGVDGLVVVSEPGLRSLETARNVSRMAADLGLTRQALVMNRMPQPGSFSLPDGLPPLAAALPRLESLEARQLESAAVLGLDERELLDAACAGIFGCFER